MFDYYKCTEQRQYTMDMVTYLKKEDLDKFDIMRVPDVVAPTLHHENPQTYVFYLDVMKDKVSSEEKEFYQEVIKDLREKENVFIEHALKKLTLSSNISQDNIEQ